MTKNDEGGAVMQIAKVERAGVPVQLATLLAGSIVILTDATVLRVREDGSADELLPSGHPRPGCAHSTATTREAIAR